MKVYKQIRNTKKRKWLIKKVRTRKGPKWSRDKSKAIVFHTYAEAASAAQFHNGIVSFIE